MRAPSRYGTKTYEEEFVAMESKDSELVLQAGEIYRQRKFESNAVNRGAALIDCEWDGGRFEAGLFMGGMFRAGEFRGGTFLGGIFWDGRWVSGTWEGGFDREGIYHSRGSNPSKR
jgi:hypothetical protein